MKVSGFMKRYYKLSTSDGKYYCILNNEGILSEIFTKMNVIIKDNCVIFKVDDNYMYCIDLTTITELNEDDFYSEIEPMINLKEHRARQIKSKILLRYRRL